MRLGFLPTLQAVLREASFAAAAQELGLTPSAVSQQMRQLEDHFGQPLFDRSGRTVRPTAFAVEVMATVNDALVGLEALRGRRRPEAAGVLRLGVVNSMQLSILPRCLVTVAARFPALQIALAAENSSAGLVESLKSGKVDAAIVVRPRTGVSRKLAWHDLHKEPFVMLVPPGRAAAPDPRKVVLGTPWIRYNSTSSSGRLASSFVRRIAPALRPVIDISTPDTVVAMVSAGLGFSVIPRPREQLLRAYPLGVVRLDRQIPQRQIALACRAADAGNRRIEAFLACARETFGSFAEQASSRPVSASTLG